MIPLHYMRCAEKEIWMFDPVDSSYLRNAIEVTVVGFKPTTLQTGA